MWSSILEQSKAKARPQSRGLYLLRFGEDAAATVTESLFTGKSGQDQNATLGGVSYGTWEPAADQNSLDSTISIWELNNEATFDNLREIYVCAATRVMYVIAVDTSSQVCTTAIEKFLLQMERHQKTCNLEQVPVAIVAIGSREDSDRMEKIEKISSRVDTSLLFVERSGVSSPKLDSLKHLVVQNLYPELDDHHMSESDRSMFHRLGRFATEDGRGDEDGADVAVSGGDAGLGKLNTTNLEAYVEDLAQEVLEEEPAVDISAIGNANIFGCAHGGSKRCERCEDLRKQESLWVGGLKDFVSNVTKTSEDASAAKVNSPALVFGGQGTGGLEDMGERKQGIASTHEDKADDATSFFQSLLSK